MRGLAIWYWLAFGSVLLAANVAIFATDSLAFMWPVMGLGDAGSLLFSRRRRTLSR
jgi:hypothetical protein